MYLLYVIRKIQLQHSVREVLRLFCFSTFLSVYTSRPNIFLIALCTFCCTIAHFVVRGGPRNQPIIFKVVT